MVFRHVQLLTNPILPHTFPIIPGNPLRFPALDPVISNATAQISDSRPMPNVTRPRTQETRLIPYTSANPCTSFSISRRASEPPVTRQLGP